MLPVRLSSLMMMTVTLLSSLINPACSLQKPSEPEHRGIARPSKSNQKAPEWTPARLKNKIAAVHEIDQKVDLAHELAVLYGEKKNTTELAKVLHFIVANSSKRPQRLAAKQKLADVHFFDLRNYSEAIRHYSHLMQVGHNRIVNHLMVVKSYFNLNNLTQSKFEAEALLKEKTKLKEDVHFEVMFVLANILFSDEKYKNAAKAYYQVMQMFPEQSKNNFVKLNLAMSYEEEGFYPKAIQTLSELKNEYHTPEFIEAKIKHLESKMKYQPGGGRTGSFNR